jgi:integrase
MGQKALALGAHGLINITLLAHGRYQAQARYRMRNGPVKQPKATGVSQGAARRAFKAKIEAMERESGFSGETTSRMTLEALVTIWTEGKLLEIELEKSGALRPQTLAEYTRLLQREVLGRPKNDVIQSIGKLRLDELTVETMERFLLSLETRHTSQPRNVRAALAGPFKLAVRRGAMPSNPLAALEAFQKPKTEVHALTEAEVIEYRALVSTYGHEPGKSGPKTMQQLPELVVVTLALACRVGEVLSLRWEDFENLDGPSPTVSIESTVVHLKNKGHIRQPRPKTSAGVRVLHVPEFAAEVLRERLRQSKGPLVFPSRTGGIMATGTFQRWMHDAVRDTSFEGTTPHTLRRTTASLLLASGTPIYEVSRMLGHSSVSVTERAYIDRTITQPNLSMPVNDLYS